VKVLEAKLTRDTDTFTAMDCFVIIEFQGQKKQTKAAAKSGKTPKWNESFTFAL